MAVVTWIEGPRLVAGLVLLHNLTQVENGKKRPIRQQMRQLLDLGKMCVVW